CQVYGGMDGEYESTNRAVNETRDMVIKHNGEIIDALYHSNSGGHTRDSKEAWGNHLPYLIGVEDRFSEGTTASTWSFSMNSSELNRNLINNGINIGPILNMEIIERTPSGRVTKIRVIGQNSEEILTESQIRQVLGTNNLRTTWFSIEGSGEYNEESFYAIGSNSTLNIINLDNSYIIADNFKSRIPNTSKINILNKDKNNIIESQISSGNGDFVIQGKGFGHGVGMSQWGAKSMADTGYTYDEILKHYYTDVDIDLIY
ncbi:MAG: SpoIID/LytB domain-containing protein, partial [Tissierellia bacterium]|nr:SpoIID/LytB domain-containing protein [Tissierellia bacterium]